MAAVNHKTTMCLYPKKMMITPTDNTSYVGLVKCGKCLECAQDYSREWSYRCELESRCWDHNCVVTLTYADTDGELCRRDAQLFMKRLREHFEPKRIRFFGCGEYGKRYKRPHYHIVLFNCSFDDCYYWKKSQTGNAMYRSPTLEKLWTAGYSVIEPLTLETVKYCAKYLQKLIDYHGKKVKPFTMMSTRPGIGALALEKYPNIVGGIVNTDKVYSEGHYIKTPQYLLRYVEKAAARYLRSLEGAELQEAIDKLESLFTIRDRRREIAISSERSEEEMLAHRLKAARFLGDDLKAVERATWREYHPDEAAQRDREEVIKNFEELEKECIKKRKEH